MDSVKLPLANVRKEKVILFLYESKPVFAVQINTLPELMGVYFYNPPKEVFKPDMLDIGEDYDSYFND